MTKRMLIDATHAEETRVVVLDGNRLEDFDVETSTKKQLKGNIYLAKVVRVEPSLQAAFVEYGGGRHGFLAFGEIHPDYYQIPVADRQKLLALQAEEAREEEEAEAAEFAREDAVPDRAPEPELAVEAEAEASGQTEPRPAEPDALPYSEAPTAPEALVTGEGSNHVPSAYAAAEPMVEDPEYREPEYREPEHRQSEHPAHVETETEIVTAPVETEVEVEAEPAQPLAVSFGEVAYGALDAGALGEAEPGAEPAVTEAEPVEEADRMPPPETIGGENDTTEGFGAAQARVRSASRILRAYRIQEVIRRRQILLIQVVKEERGTKGAALTTYISLAGRFCVLMPNSPRGGGISRKITSGADRRRLKEITAELEVPKGMGLIVRTAGAARPKPEIRRDCEYLMRLWDDIREHTMQSVAPALIYEEASLIKRAIRDVYSREVSEILVDGEAGWRSARDFMRMLMPDHAKKVQLWRPANANGNAGALFAAEQVEAQLDAMNSPTVQLKSGGYLVINQTEALVAIDVNSGRSTRERGIEETALKTNLEAADEVARQLRLRDLAGLIVIDFIDMEARRHNTMVEKRIQDALKNDRARIQIGHISHFGLLEMSRQRLRPSLAETSFVPCSHCGGTGHMRSTESSAVHVLRAIEEECGKMRGGHICVHVAGPVALYLLNHKRDRLSELEERFGMRIHLAVDDTLLPPNIRIERLKLALAENERPAARPMVPQAPAGFDAIADDEVAEVADETFDEEVADEVLPVARTAVAAAEAEESGRPRRRRRRRGARREGEPGDEPVAEAPSETSAAPESPEAEHDQAIAAEPATAAADDGASEQPAVDAELLDENGLPKARRRGRRGGRRRRRDGSVEDTAGNEGATDGPAEPAPPAYVGPTPADPFGARPFDIYDLMDEDLPPLAIPPIPANAGPPPPVEALAAGSHAMEAPDPEPPVVERLPEPHEEPSTFRAADREPAPHAAPLFEPQPEAAPELVASPEPVAAEASTQAAPPESTAPEPEPEPEPAPVYAPVLVGGDVVPESPKRGWWRR